ncbi:hypothetical protein OHA25_59970 (plasmid) [Nonomuraea sp. NBC_00507]
MKGRIAIAMRLKAGATAEDIASAFTMAAIDLAPELGDEAG